MHRSSCRWCTGLIVAAQYRSQVRAALADLRYLQGFLTDLGDASTTNVSNGEELARLLRRTAVELGKIADAIEGELGEEEE